MAGNFGHFLFTSSCGTPSMQSSRPIKAVISTVGRNLLGFSGAKHQGNTALTTSPPHPNRSSLRYAAFEMTALIDSIIKKQKAPVLDGAFSIIS